MAQGTTDGVEILDRAVVLFTTTGAQSGKARYVPLMRVEEDGKYAMVASKGGDPKHPSWYFNVRANPEVTIRIRGVAERRIARNARPEEIERLWPRLVALWPPYEHFFARTHERAIFVLEVPASKQA